MNIHPRVAALISITLWSVGVLFVLELNRLPPFLIIAFSTSISLILSAILLTATGRWKSIAPSKGLLFPASLLLITNQTCYVLAFRGAPAAQVDLINYLWPSMLVLLTGQFTNRYIGYLVVACGSGGIFIALDPAALGWSYLFGYGAALVAALSWTGYSLLMRKHKLPPEFICINIGLGAPLFWALHFFLKEPITAITIREAALLFFWGGGVYVVAYLSWGYALKFGSVVEASALSYLVPPLSIIALSLFGYVELTSRILWATILIVLAGAIPMLACWLEGLASPVENKSHVKA